MKLGGYYGTVDTKALTEFLMGRHPKRVRAAKQAWENRTDESLVDKLSDSLDPEGQFVKICLRMLRGGREMNDAADEAQAVEQCNAIKDAFEAFEESGEKGGFETVMIETICDNSPPENKELARIFEDTCDMSLRRAIKKGFDNDAEDALISLTLGPYDYYAAELKKALHAEEIDDKAICRIVGSHDKDEIKAIAASYEKKYSTDLKGAISGACKGEYRRLAVAWVDLSDQLGQPEKVITIPKEE